MRWVLAFHIIGIITWMGGLMTVGRLLGYHAALESAEARNALVEYEKKSYRLAIMPAFLVTLTTGLIMLFAKGDGVGHYLSVDGPWYVTFHLKLTLVTLLIILDQLVFARMRKLHTDDEGTRGFFMAMHGAIGLLFILIVIIVKVPLLR